jgi:transcription antitermination factor NusG
LFPGYVFCRVHMHNRLPVLTTPGVVSIIGAGKEPLPVSEEEIEAVRTIVKSKLFASPWPFLRVGEEVEITRGPLTGVRGIFVKIKTNFRLVVSVTLLRRSVAVEIDGDWACPIPRNGRVITAPEFRAPRASLSVAGD